MKRLRAAEAAREEKLRVLALSVPQSPLEEAEVVEIVLASGELRLGRIRALKSVSRTFCLACRRLVHSNSWQRVLGNRDALAAAFRAVRALHLPATVLIPGNGRIVVLKSIACSKKRDESGRVVIEAAEAADGTPVPPHLIYETRPVLLAQTTTGEAPRVAHVATVEELLSEGSITFTRSYSGRGARHAPTAVVRVPVVGTGIIKKANAARNIAMSKFRYTAEEKWSRNDVH